MATRESDSGGGQEVRYAEVTLGDDELVIYDRENHQSWVQSSIAFPLESIR